MYYKDGNTYRNATHYRLHDTLVTEADNRRGDDWAERERKAMLRVVNDERSQRRTRNPDGSELHYFTGSGKRDTRHSCSLPLSEVERVEQLALGHTDYGIKFALYCSELVELSYEDPERLMGCGTCGWKGKWNDLAQWDGDSHPCRCPFCEDEDQIGPA